jgi:exosome complex RNA-binding protein Csl4
VGGEVLSRIEDYSSSTPVSEHEDIVAAVVAGKHQVDVEEVDFSYGVYADGAG